MGLWQRIKEAVKILFRKEIREAFNIDVKVSSGMEQAINEWYNITGGNPPWLDPEDDVKTINAAAFISDLTANLVTLDIGVKVSGGARAEWLQKHADYILRALPDKVAVALGNAGIILKPNGENVDYIEPGNFFPTDVNSNGDILGCAFRDEAQMIAGEKTVYYTKWEWQRFEQVKDEAGNPVKVYTITNLCYESDSPNKLGTICPLWEVAEWAPLQHEISIKNIEKPLFGFFKNPAANWIDHSSALGVPVWGKSIEELRDLDIAWSRKATEVEDSKHVTMVSQMVQQYADRPAPGASRIKLPRFVAPILYADGLNENMVHEHTATLLTEDRIKDINSILALISLKCGFSQGFLKLDEKTGMMTATQVESDDQETIRSIKNIRDNLQAAINDCLYALDVMASLYRLAPAGSYEVDYSFGDLLYNFHEDQQHHYSLAMQGKYPWVEYYVKFLKYSREEAEELLATAKKESVVNTPYALEE